MYALYGTNYKYGTASRLYGVDSAQTALYLWGIQIDWDGDLVYDGQNESAYTIGLDTRRGFSDLYNVSSEGDADFFAPPDVGEAIVTVDNSSGRYDLWETNGDPSTDIQTGRLAKITVRINGETTDTPVFSGYVHKITNDDTNKTAQIILHDGIEILQNKRANSAVSTTDNVTTAIQKILDDIDWQWGNSVASLLAINYFYPNESAYKELFEVSKFLTSRVFYTDANGDLQLETIEGYSTTDPLLPTAYDGDIFIKPILLSQPWDNLFTQTEAYAHPYTAGTTDTQIWTQGDGQITIAGSSSISFYVNYQYETSNNDGKIFAIPNSLISSSDYVVNTASNGSGSDITGSISITVTNYGSKALLAITNANASTGYFTVFTLRGTPYTISSVTTLADGVDYTGLGHRKIMIQSKYNQGVLEYSSPINFYSLSYPHTTKVVTAKLQTRAEQFEKDINNVVLFNVTKPYLSSKLYLTLLGQNVNYNQFRIMQITHKWLNNNGQDVLTTWKLRHVLFAFAPTEF